MGPYRGFFSWNHFISAHCEHMVSRIWVEKPGFVSCHNPRKEWFAWWWRTLDRSIAIVVRSAFWASEIECGTHLRENLRSPSSHLRISLIVCFDWPKDCAMTPAVAKGIPQGNQRELSPKREEDDQAWIDFRMKDSPSRSGHSTLWFESASKL
jgi:hypothetical protein